MDHETQERALGALALEEIWGIAKRTAEKLRARNIATPLALRAADPKAMRQAFGVTMERLVLELRGTPCHALELHAPEKQSICVSRSFGRPVTDRQELEEAMSAYVERAAEKLRRCGLSAGYVSAFLQTNRFAPGEPQYNPTGGFALPVSTSDTASLLRASRDILGSLWKPGYRYKKAGVLLLQLAPHDQTQGGLWGEPDHPKRQALMQVVDALNRTHGRRAVQFASSGVNRGWQLRSAQKSPNYTTCWDELVEAG